MALQNGSLILSEGLKVQRLISLANLTTWRVGGPAEWFAEPTTVEELKYLIYWATKNKIPCQIIGGGSNLLINDHGLTGLSVCLRKLNGLHIDRENGVIQAAAGESIPNLARKAAKAGLHGLEWAIGIPGTVGGAAVMNAGAQGSCTSEWLESVEVMPLNGEQSFELSPKELDFSYRHSRLQEESLIVLSARFRLKPGHNSEALLKTTNENLTHRTSTQPYHLPSCGSVFRNPKPLKAGMLIENVGLKGHRIGGAEISKIHANFIVNVADARASEIDQLIQLIKCRIKKAHGLNLHTEVKKFGFGVNA